MSKTHPRITIRTTHHRRISWHLYSLAALGNREIILREMIIFRIISTIFSQIKIVAKILHLFLFCDPYHLAIYKKLINITFK